MRRLCSQLRWSWMVAMPASASDPPRLRTALNSPAASPASSRGTDAMAAWLRKRKPNTLPMPRSNCDRSEERRVGKECVVRVDLGGRRIIKKKIEKERCTTSRRTQHIEQQTNKSNDP